MSRKLIVVVAVLTVATATWVGAPSAEAIAIISNNIYEAHIQREVDGNSVGSWNAVTAAGHPTGADNNILFDESTVTTNFSSLRVFSATGGVVDYSFGGRGGSIDMDSYVASDGASPLGNGWRTTWDIQDIDNGVDLAVTQDVLVVGSDFGNSAVYHTVDIFNYGASTDIGWRNLYDWAVNDPGFDDGPANSIETSGGGIVVPSTTNEFSHTPGADEFARVTVNPGVPTYEPLLALGYDPGFFGLSLTLPTEYAYVSWPGAVGTAFDYVPGGSNVTSDSAGLSWFGRDANSAIHLASEGSVRLTQIVFGVVGGEPPPGTAPVPGTVSLMVLGLAALGLANRRKK